MGSQGRTCGLLPGACPYLASDAAAATGEALTLEAGVVLQ